MTLHLFVDVNKEMLIHAFQGDEKGAARFLNHNKEHKITHIRVQNGEVFVGGK